MGVTERSLTGNISRVTLSGSLSAESALTGELKIPDRVSENDYEKLINLPSINGVELIRDKSFEDLGDSTISNFEILELMKTAGF